MNLVLGSYVSTVKQVKFPDDVKMNEKHMFVSDVCVRYQVLNSLLQEQVLDAY